MERRHEENMVERGDLQIRACGLLETSQRLRTPRRVMAMSGETLAERRLIGYAKRAFGERLTSFLLCGLNEQGVVRRRTFIVKQKIGEDAEEVRINIFSDGPEGLPKGRHPLVLLALLKLWL